jgi:uncharacterized 2Fe-2S/4Fe-4S cluster protein (DUF4445 family)
MAYTIDFEPIGIRLLCQEPLTVRKAALQAGVSIQSTCGGKGTCGKCLVRVESRAGPSSPVTEAEQILLTTGQIAEGWRLACRTIISSDTLVYIPSTSQAEGHVFQTESLEIHSAPAPAVRSLSLSLQPPSLDDQTADLERVADALHRRHGIDGASAGLPALHALRLALREGNWQIAVALRDGEIIAAYPGAGAPPVGLAVDVGTSKLACYLVSLESGRTLAAAGVMNPQIVYGEDVMSRLAAAMVDPAKAIRLQKGVIEAINTVSASLCASQGLRPEHLLDLCLVGNTAMHHLFAGLPVRPLAVAPFVPALRSPLDVQADRFGLHAAPGARAYLPAPIAGFVGSDHLAFLLATGFGEDERIRLGIDIGTNTEIALQVGNRIVSCSTASGPAFEGAHIRHGMGAAPGAIERVRIGQDGLAQCDVIGNGSPRGICGSGILDALAELRRVDIIDVRGRMRPDAPNVHREPDGMLAYTLARSDDGQRDVALTQGDVDQVLLAKGAIRAGIDILLDHLSVRPSDIEEMLIAGAFGSYLDPVSAVRVGLLPDVPSERIRAVGNAAGAGARMLLASTERRTRGRILAGLIEYLELTVVPRFNRYFAGGVRLPVL